MDDVLLLGKGGRTVYLGDAQTAIKYFEVKILERENEMMMMMMMTGCCCCWHSLLVQMQALGFELPLKANPADWFLDIISGALKRPNDPNFKAPEDFDYKKELAKGLSDKYL